MILPTSNQTEPADDGIQPVASLPTIPAPAPSVGANSFTQKVRTDASLAEAEQIAALCRQFDQLLADPSHSLRTAAAALGKSPSYFSGPQSPYARFRREGLAGLLPARREDALKPSMDLPDWFIAAAKFFYLLSNRATNSGSVPEAVRRVISLPSLPFGWTTAMADRLKTRLGLPEIPSCPPDLRESILRRQAAGKPLVPPSVHRRIMVPEPIVQFHRSPRDWSLAHLSAPGSQRRFTNSEGERIAKMPGDWFGGDDSTPGIAVCVPVKPEEITTPTTQRFGVMLGRFQWLPFDDCRTDKILAWDYVIRPRGSYRAEDILSGMHAVVRTHGIPRQGWQFEGGVWNSKLVRNCISVMGTQHWRTYSPHQKTIESVFNRIWTRLAVQFPHADMGRRRGENEANCDLYESCKAAQKDPRNYFPDLETVLKVIEEEVAAHNSKRIDSAQYGAWVPDNYFEDSTSKNPLRQFSEEMDWMFSPYCAERTVRGMLVGCRVPMFEDFSIPFEFGADWLPLYSGKKVRIHFNPRLPKCRAKVLLASPMPGKPEGTVLGDAELIGETSSYIRYILNWGSDNQRAGYLARQRVNNFVRRETRGIGVGGRVSYSRSELKDGLQKVAILEKNLDGVELSGTDDPAQPRPIALAPEEVEVHNSPAAGLESSEAAHFRRTELETLRRETEHLFQ